jgi:hypothetical protein
VSVPFDIPEDHGVGQEGYVHSGVQGPLGTPGSLDPADYGAAIKQGFAPPPGTSLVGEFYNVEQQRPQDPGRSAIIGGEWHSDPYTDKQGPEPLGA